MPMAPGVCGCSVIRTRHCGSAMRPSRSSSASSMAIRTLDVYWNSAIRSYRREWPIVEERAAAAIASAQERGLAMVVGDSRQSAIYSPSRTKLEKHGKGIILMHDFQHATAEALPEIIRQLKDGGYKVVHNGVPLAGDDTIEIRRNARAAGQAIGE
jgi:peptidoglycan/xylan/chitin deacetylase (PgdA/CDA1 family)